MILLLMIFIVYFVECLPVAIIVVGELSRKRINEILMAHHAKLAINNYRVPTSSTLIDIGEFHGTIAICYIEFGVRLPLGSE